MGGYPAWFLCVAHPLPVPISNRKGLKQRREEHWLPGNCNTKWRNSRGELWYKQASLSDLSCGELWVTMQNRVLHPQMLLGQTGGEVIYQMRWTWHERTKKKLSLRHGKDRDNIILSICFASVNSEFPPLQYPPMPLQDAGPLFSQNTCVSLSTSWYAFHTRMEIWTGKLCLLYTTSPSVSNWPVVKFPQHFLEILYFLLVFHNQWSGLRCHQWRSTVAPLDSLRNEDTFVS